MCKNHGSSEALRDRLLDRFQRLRMAADVSIALMLASYPDGLLRRGGSARSYEALPPDGWLQKRLVAAAGVHAPRQMLRQLGGGFDPSRSVTFPRPILRALLRCRSSTVYASALTCWSDECNFMHRPFKQQNSCRVIIIMAMLPIINYFHL